MAKMFDVKTMNGSSVTPKIAGIESSAKTTSESSIIASARKSGVATRAAALADEEAWPWYSSSTARPAAATGSTGFFSGRGSSSSSLFSASRTPVTSEERAEDVDEPVEAGDEGRAAEDHPGAQHDRAEDAPEQDAVLVD